MELRSVSYSENRGRPNEWSIDGLDLQPLNLIVGMNAVGKSRTLSVIKGLGALLAGSIKLIYSSGLYDVTFTHDHQTLRYVLEYQNRKVTREEFYRNGENLLERSAGGIGKIWHEREGKKLDFQTPQDELAAAVRQDAIQHRYLEPLSMWGKSLRFYPFGESMGRNTVAMFVKDSPPSDPTEADQVVAVFRKGQREFDRPFVELILADMKAVGYSLTDIGLRSPESVMVRSSFPVEPQVVYVQEAELAAPTEQTGISTGMFRVLSVSIHLNYALLSGRPSCILVDDIGEGLDFERSTKLLDLLVSKVTGPGVQLILSTNSRFIMNRVPLQAWSLLHRQGGKVRVYNYQNSREAFEEFKFTGLSNFDFLATDFIHEAVGAEVERE